jgi:carbonic anhydrase
LNIPFDVNFSLDHLLSKEKIFNFWFYRGSITLPPCSDGKIYWIVPDKIFQMSTDQLEFFQKLYPGGNWRDVQKDQGNAIAYSVVLPSA